MYVGDTIAAIATPAGVGAIGILRISGPQCLEIAARSVRARRPVHQWQQRRMYRCEMLAADGTVIDSGLAVLMRGPHSYTGEDLVELHAHGNPLVLRHLLTAVLKHGARQAQPGEFSKRAFLNGRMDLTQAEAVADLIQARSDAAASLAVAQLGGGLSAILNDLRADLVQLKALLEAQIDFAEEEVSIRPEQLAEPLQRACRTTSHLMETYGKGALLRAGARVAIIGKPNVGKSSLLNALLGRNRAIVADTPGTTRDTIEESLDFAGIPVTLTDTAGLRAEPQADAVERLGMQRTAAALQQADLRLVVLDRTAHIEAADRALLESVEKLTHLIVVNKIDLPAPADATALADLLNGRRVQHVSALRLQGLKELKDAAADLLLQGAAATGDGSVISNPRHLAALERAHDALELARQSLSIHQPADILAVDVQNALDQIAEITGAVTNEEVLDRIFQEFCIGK